MDRLALKTPGNPVEHEEIAIANRAAMQLIDRFLAEYVDLQDQWRHLGAASASSRDCFWTLLEQRRQGGAWK